ncbi:hypothetical protein BLNAU_10444 [Blattamonas nauphoetae]|uniref:Uncharacterized protein n=1 Tax=Blattamonas nauphoetae TaxID=2049346 RepID=A0ABQ9XQC1_9EUKA|nr:hypothetical protein BLNAU_10444 [Blattamonas nauphoetae]
MKTVEHISTNPAAVNTLTMVNRCLVCATPSLRLTLVSSKLFPTILSTPHVNDLSVIEDQQVLREILMILHNPVTLLNTTYLGFPADSSDTGPQSVRNVVLHEVLIPIEPSLVQISRNPRFVLWNDESQEIWKLFFDFFESLLTEVEHEYARESFIYTIFDKIRSLKRLRGAALRRRRVLMEILKIEGILETVEQSLLHENNMTCGRNVRRYSIELLNKLGMNYLWPT